MKKVNGRDSEGDNGVGGDLLVDKLVMRLDRLSSTRSGALEAWLCAISCREGGNRGSSIVSAVVVLWEGGTGTSMPVESAVACRTKPS